MKNDKKYYYGTKRDYPKIDLFLGGRYFASTTWARSCKEAVQRFHMTYPASCFSESGKITARFSKHT